VRGLFKGTAWEVRLYVGRMHGGKRSNHRVPFHPIVLPLFPFLVSLLSLADVFVSLRNLIMGELEVCS